LPNANVWTANAAEPRREVVAIARGRFLAAASNSDVLNLAGRGVQKIDLRENPSTLITIPIEPTMTSGRWSFEA